MRRLAPLLLALAACGGSSSAQHTSSTIVASTPPTTMAAQSTSSTAPTATTPPTSATTVPSTTATTAPPPTPPATVAAPAAASGGRVVVIDPGHNGGNASHPAEINRLVDIGVGKKACNTVGAETNDGYPEHAFTWDVSNRVAQRLRGAGVTVVLTRPNDTGWGPCSVDRAAIANRAGALASVSIHADGGPPGGRGFHVIEPALLNGLTDDIYSSSQRLGHAVHDAVEHDTAMPPSTYAGSNGYMLRSDLGGLDRADVPAIFIECGNMRNATDASMLKDAAFRQRLADAIANGILRFIGA